MSIETGFLFPEVVLLAGCEYRKIPGYVSAYAGKNGKILFIKSDGSIKEPTTFEWKTTKGTYLYVKIITDDFVQVTKAIHQLVCLAYHGNPPTDGKLYEPNHIDLNKHNNKPENLEWSHRSQNVQHAYDSGVCQQGIRIEMVDILQKKTTRFNSLSSLSRKLGVSRYGLRDILARHRDIPYMHRYLFITDTSSDRKLKRHQSRSVVFKNYITDEIVVCDSATEASELTKVNASTIVFRTNGKCKEETQNSLLSCFVFKPMAKNLNWPNYTKEQAIASKTLFEEKQRN